MVVSCSRAVDEKVRERGRVGFKGGAGVDASMIVSNFAISGPSDGAVGVWKIDVGASTVVDGNNGMIS